METRKTVLDTVGGFMEAEDWRFRTDEYGTVIETAFRDDSGAFEVKIFTGERAPVLCILVLLPLIVPENRRLAVAEAMARINFGLVLGAFEIEMSRGMVGFRASMPVADAVLTFEQLRHLLFGSCLTAGHYYRAFCRLLYADDLSPAEAVAEVEMAGREADTEE